MTKKQRIIASLVVGVALWSISLFTVNTLIIDMTSIWRILAPILIGVFSAIGCYWSLTYGDFENND